MIGEMLSSETTTVDIGIDLAFVRDRGEGINFATRGVKDLIVLLNGREMNHDELRRDKVLAE
jgi:hypothetical protein